MTDEEIKYVSPEDAGVTDTIGILNVYLVEYRHAHQVPMFIYAVEEDDRIVLRDRDSDFEFKTILTAAAVREAKPIYGFNPMEELVRILMFEVLASRDATKYLE